MVAERNTVEINGPMFAEKLTSEISCMCNDSLWEYGSCNAVVSIPRSPGAPFPSATMAGEMTPAMASLGYCREALHSSYT